MEPTPQNSTEDFQSEIDKLMSQYSAPAKVTETARVENGAGSVQSPPSASASPLVVAEGSQPPVVAVQMNATNAEAPYGYYKRGKDKGKPRTTPYINAKGQSSAPAPTPVQPAPAPQAKLNAMLINAGMFLTLVNLIVPLAISGINNYIEKDKKKYIDLKRLALTKDQIKELDPVVDAVIKQVSLTGNPLVLLFFGLFAAYGLNLMMVKMDIK